MIENGNGNGSAQTESGGNQSVETSALGQDEGVNAAVAAAATAGEKLRLAREASGIHINTLAATLKVNVKVLEALEAGRYEELPGIPFTRALAASICRNLQVDAKPVLELLPDSQPEPLAEPQMQSPVVLDQGGSPWFGWLKHPVTWVVLLVIIAGAVFWILPYVLDKTTPEPLRQPGENVVEELVGNLDGGGVIVAQPPAAAPVPETSVSAVSAVPATAPVTGAAGVGSALIAPPSNGADRVVPSSPLVSDLAATNLQDAAQQQATTGAGGAVSAVIPADRELVLQATGESWVEVKNSRGAVLHSTTMQAGDILPVAGSRPYQVVVGKQENVKVYVMGQPYAFGTENGQGTARFGVK